MRTLAFSKRPSGEAERVSSTASKACFKNSMYLAAPFTVRRTLSELVVFDGTTSKTCGTVAGCFRHLAILPGSIQRRGKVALCLLRRCRVSKTGDTRISWRAAGWRQFRKKAAA
jgi:hypothetical protein